MADGPGRADPAESPVPTAEKRPQRAERDTSLPNDVSQRDQLHQTIGNSALGRLVQRPPLAEPAETPGQRHHAARLGAPDAVAVAIKQFPTLAHVFTKERLAPVQRVIDEAVINPDDDRQAADLDLGSVDYIQQAGGPVEVITDPQRHRRAQQVRAEKLHTTGADDAVRLGGDELLPDDLLQVDNPVDEDEQQIIVNLFEEVAAHGIWLSLDHAAGPDFSIRIGKSGKYMPAFTRLALRSHLGLPDSARRGSISSALEANLARLDHAIESGLSEHQDLAHERRVTTFGVVEASDFFGGADFPSDEIWNAPRVMVASALETLHGRNTVVATSLTSLAAGMTASAAKTLSEYQDDTIKGATRVVKVLKVLETAGHVAQAALAIIDGVALIKAGAEMGSKALLGFRAARSSRALTERAAIRETVDATADVAETTAAREARKQLARDRAAADAKKNADRIAAHNAGETGAPVGGEHQELIKDTYVPSEPLAHKAMTEEEELASMRYVKGPGTSVKARVDLKGPSR